MGKRSEPIWRRVIYYGTLSGPLQRVRESKIENIRRHLGSSSSHRHQLEQLAPARSLLLCNMGFRGTGTSRAFCDRPGCGRRGYVDDGTRFLCHVCHHERNTHETRSVLKEVRGSPARQSRTPLQVILHNPALVQLCMEMLHEEDEWAWALQCPCTRCKRQWLNRGWECPVEHHRELYLRLFSTPRVSEAPSSHTWTGIGQSCRCTRCTRTRSLGAYRL